jgi:hypothetical protein
MIIDSICDWFKMFIFVYIFYLKMFNKSKVAIEKRHNFKQNLVYFSFLLLTCSLILIAVDDQARVLEMLPLQIFLKHFWQLIYFLFDFT